MAAIELLMRPLKKAKLGPPDCYPQDPTQREDDLSETNVKRGFSNQPAISHEHGSAKDFLTIPLSKENSLVDLPGKASPGQLILEIFKFAVQYNGIQLQKQKISSFPDGSKKKLQINTKDNFWPVTARNKSQVTQWFQELASNKTLTQLGKKVPIFNKKEEIFSSLCEHAVPMFRAAWFLKVTNAYQNTISEVKVKKRLNIDPSQEWTHGLTKFLREQLSKLVDLYSQPYANMTLQRPSPEVENAIKQWEYGIRLAEWLLQESLLDKQEFLQWLIDLIDRFKTHDDALLKHVFPLILKHLNLITQTQTLSRNLATQCIKKLMLLNYSAEQIQAQSERQQEQPKTPTDGSQSGANGQSAENIVSRSDSPTLPVLSEYKGCNQHRSLVIILCGIIQAITLRCPSALVWSAARINTTSLPSSSEKGSAQPSVKGSPLDLLPCSPSSLMDYLSSDDPDEQQDCIEMQKALQDVELEIQRRGQAVERRWLSAAHQETTFVNNKLKLLDLLDKINFSRAGKLSTVDVLYERIFEVEMKDATENTLIQEKCTIMLLLNWAVNKKRHGKYRAIAVAKLLDRRNTELLEEMERRRTESPDGACDTLDLEQYPYQSQLMEFLDNEAPIPENYHNPLEDESFEQLVLLFGEIIRNDVFSHNDYMCLLISRGDIGCSSLLDTPVYFEDSKSRTESPSGMPVPLRPRNRHPSLTDHDYQGHSQMDLENELLQHQRQIQQLLDRDGSLLNPAVFSSSTSRTAAISMDTSVDLQPIGDESQENPRDQSRAHAFYATHFPIPYDTEGSHEANQRAVLLFGVGKLRKHTDRKVGQVMKKLTDMMREVNEMGIWMNEYDNRLNKAELERKNVHNEKKLNLMREFLTLSKYDQYNLASRCGGILQNLKQSRPSEYGICASLPSIYQLAFVLDLFEIAGDIQGLINFTVEFISPREVGYMIPHPQTSSVKGTLPTKLTLIVALLRKYYSSILTSAEQTCVVFRGLLQTVENIADPGVCSSTERCVLSFLYDLYVTCEHLRDRYSEIFSTACTKIGQSVCSNTQPSNTSLLWETSVLSDYFQNPRNMQLDTIWLRHLSEDRPADLYSFVCNTILNVSKSQDVERLYDMSVLCAEVDAHISALSSEWLGVLKSMCCTSAHGLGFDDLHGAVNVNDNNVQENISTFISVLVARRSFSLADCLKHVVIPSLSSALPTTIDHEVAHPGARLSCHIVLKLFDATNDFLSSPCGCLSHSPFKATPEHSLLVGCFEHVPFEIIVMVLKLLLMLSEAGPSSNNDTLNVDPMGDEVFESLFNMNGGLQDPLSNSDDLFGATPFGNMPKSNSSDVSTSLNSFAGYACQVICSQGWIQQKFVQESQKLLTRDILLDPRLTVKQVKRLIVMCSTTGNHDLSNSLSSEDYQMATNRICKNLNHWSLSISSLELQLMIQQAAKEEVSLLYNAIARSVMSALTDNADGTVETNNDNDNGKHTLIGPLIGKLPATVQGRILKTAGEIMEKGKWWIESENSRLAPASQQTLFNLILSCLKGQDDNRAAFLSSLQKQFTNLVTSPEEERFPFNSKARTFLLDALHLRMNLVGAMFDTIQKSKKIIGDWALCLFQLVVSGIITEESTEEYTSMYTDLLDMISVLLTTVQMTEGSQASQNNPSSDMPKYSLLVKRLRKEIIGKSETPSIYQCRQLLPLTTMRHEIICMGPVNLPVSTQSGSSTPLNKDKADDVEHSEQGLKANGVQYVSPWDLLEDHKNPAPLNWAWFGAVRMERKPLKYLEQARRLLHHTHVRRRPLSYYTNPELNPEEDEQSLDLEVQEVDKTSQPATPSAESPTPRSKSALAQLLASVQGGDHLSPTDTKQLTPQKERGRKRSVRTGSSQSTTPVSGNLTPVQQKNFQLLLQQQQPQQGNVASTGQIVLGQQGIAASTARTPTQDTKDAIQAMLASRSQASSSIPQPSMATSQNPLLPLQQFARQKQHQQQQQQQQLQQQQQQQQQQLVYSAHEQPPQLTLSSQRPVGRMINQAPPNVQLPANIAASSQQNLGYSTQQPQLQGTLAQASNLQPRPSQSLQNPQMLTSQLAMRTQRNSVNQQRLLQAGPSQPNTSALHQLLQRPLQQQFTPEQQQQIQQRRNQKRYQYQPQLAAVMQQRQHQQQQQQQLQQRTTQQSAMLNQLQRQLSNQGLGLQQSATMQRQLSAPDAGLQAPLQPPQTDLQMYQRQLSAPQNAIQQQLQNLLPSNSQYSVGNAPQYQPPPGQY